MLHQFMPLPDTWKSYEKEVSGYFFRGTSALHFLLQQGADHPCLKKWMERNWQSVQEAHERHLISPPGRLSYVSPGISMRRIDYKDPTSEHVYKRDGKNTYLICAGCLFFHGVVRKGMPHCPIHFCDVRTCLSIIPQYSCCLPSLAGLLRTWRVRPMVVPRDVSM